MAYIEKILKDQCDTYGCDSTATHKVFTYRSSYRGNYCFLHAKVVEKEQENRDQAELNKARSGSVTR